MSATGFPVPPPLPPSSLAFPHHHIARVFTLAVRVQDLQLDNPEAGHLLALFLGRAIVDEALPPSFLAAVLPNLENHSEGVSVVQSTGPTTPPPPPHPHPCLSAMFLSVCVSVCYLTMIRPA